MLVIDDMLRARVTRELRIAVIAHRRDHLRRAQLLRELHRVVAHRPGAALHQHGLALHAARHQDSMHRRERGDAEACARLVGRSLRHRHGLRSRQGDELRRGAEGPAPCAVPQPYAFTDARAVDSFAHRVDHAHAVAVRNDSWKGELRAAQPRARLHVRRVDAAPQQLDAHFAGTGNRVGQVTELQDFARGAGALVKGRLHLTTILPFIVGWKLQM